MTEATPLEHAFAAWCADANMAEEADAPHGEAFYAGYHAATADVIALCAKSPEELRPATAGLTLREVRDTIQWLRYEAQNRHEVTFAEAADVMTWLAHEVLATEDNNYGRGE